MTKELIHFTIYQIIQHLSTDLTNMDSAKNILTIRGNKTPLSLILQPLFTQIFKLQLNIFNHIPQTKDYLLSSIGWQVHIYANVYSSRAIQVLTNVEYSPQVPYFHSPSLSWVVPKESTVVLNIDKYFFLNIAPSSTNCYG